MKKLQSALFVLLFCALGHNAFSQQKVGDQWVDNNLSFKVVEDNVHRDGSFTICIINKEKDLCIENLQTGFKVKVLDGNKNELWEGIATGRSSTIKLPKKFDKAVYLSIEAFKPYVTNKLTRTRIHQDKPISIIYKIK